MDKALSYIYSINIEDAELEELEKVLKNYDIKCISIEKIRSAYKITSEEKVYCLKKLGKGYKRAQKSYFLSNALQLKGFNNLAPYVYTTDNEYLIKYKKSSYYITEWIDGEEVNFKNIDDILLSAKFLAEFHLAARGLRIPGNIKIKNRHGLWIEHFNMYIDDVKRFEKKINKKSKITGFDLIYRNNLESFMDEAAFALDLLKTPEAKLAFEEAEKEKYICHDSYYYQNILRDKDGKMYLIDLESSILDSPMCDLGKFIRRVICKNRFKWDFDLCRRIIDAYDSVRPIAQEDLYLLLAMISFPHKFWKLGKKRYKKKKQWSEVNYQKKIIKVINLQSYKYEFVRNFVLFYGINICDATAYKMYSIN